MSVSLNIKVFFLFLSMLIRKYFHPAPKPNPNHVPPADMFLRRYKPINHANVRDWFLSVRDVTRRVRIEHAPHLRQPVDVLT